jgi:uncharacterized protein YciI
VSRFAVIRRHGPAWDSSRSLREQDEWDEHAEFMDGLTDEGFIVLAGPLGDSGRVLIVIDAEDEAEVRARLAADPWTDTGLLVIERVDVWNVLLEHRPR